MKRELLLSLVATTYLMADGLTLEPIIVTATKTETTLEDAPGSVSVVTQEEINLLPRASVKETVKNLEGITALQHRGLSDVNPTVVLRGIPDQSRTMILLDGVPMNTCYTSSAATPYNMAIEELERVEVIRGPFSSLYGSSAMGGVINYITRMPDEPEYTASIGYGDAFNDGEAQENLTKIHVSAADKLTDTLKFKVAYSAMHTDGYKSDFVAITTQPPATISGYNTEPSPTGGIQYIVGNAGNRDIHKDDISTKLLYTPTSKDTLSASYRRSRYDVTYYNPESFLKDAAGDTVYSYNISGNRLRESKFLQGSSELTSHLYVLDYIHNFSDSTLDLRYSLLSVEDWYTAAGTTATLSGGSGTFTPRDVKNLMLHATWQKPLGNSLLLLGGEYKNNEAVSDTYALSNWTDEDSTTAITASSGGKERNVAGFAELQSDLTDKLSANIGGRFEAWKGYDGYTTDYLNPTNTDTNVRYASRSQNNFSPKISLNYAATDNTMLKASWGKAFRAPDPVNLYRTYEITAMNRVYVSNPDLTPEKSESYDFGIEQTIMNNGLFKAYCFHTVIDDMISTKPPVVIDGKSYYERVNVGKARSQGYELSYIQPLEYDLTLKANYTKTYTKILENDLYPTLVGKRFEGIPEDMANVTLSYDSHKYYALLGYSYQSKIYNNSDNSDVVSGVYGSLDAVGIINTKIGYRVNKNIDVNLAITNLMDKEYYSYEKAEGRAWFLQANFKL